MSDEKEPPEEVLAAGGVSKERRTPGQRSRRKKEEVRRSLSSPGRFKDSSTSEMEEEEDESRPLLKSESAPEPPPKPAARRSKASRNATRLEEAQKKKKAEAKTEVKAEARVEEQPKPAEQPEELKIAVDEPKEAEKPELPKEEVKEEPKNEQSAEPAKPATARDSWWKIWPTWGRKRSKSVELEPSEAVEVSRRQSLTKETVEEGVRKRRPMRNSKGTEDLTVDDTTDSFWKNEVAKAVLKKSSPVDDGPKGRFSFGNFIRETKFEYKLFVLEHPEDVRKLKLLRNRCISDFIIILIYCGLGAFVFKFTEGAFESFYKCGVKRVKRDFIDELWKGSHYMREDEWKSKARRKLLDFENQLHEAFDAGMTSYSGQKSWSFLNSVIYCLTVVSTIGYGHIAPSTVTGRALTIVYAVFGIPMFLILLADFGKMFTRGIKWIWAFVRRLYYTGSCKKVRKTVPVQGVMKGVQVMYDMATFRRPSQVAEGVEGEAMAQQVPLPLPPPPQQPPEENPAPHSPTSGEPPSTPAPSNFAIDDEFNLPITVAIVILVIYIMCGAAVFWIWEEDWTFFDAFYFVFISMSTIGFGDLVPKNKMYMMASIVYLAFGLALTTMCINVVQEKLSDTFRQATAKIGATIGLTVSGEDGTITPATPANIELAQVHKSPSQS